MSLQVDGRDKQREGGSIGLNRSPAKAHDAADGCKFETELRANRVS